MSPLWDILKSRPDPSVAPETNEINRLTERALTQAAANQAQLEKDKAAHAKHQQQQERLASEIAARYGRTE